MSDFEDKLNGILSNPDAMAQIANLAQSLNLGGGGGGAQPEEPANASPALPSGGGGDDRLQLLYALRPFLKPEKRDKVERAVKAARLIHVGKKLLSTMGESDV